MKHIIKSFIISTIIFSTVGCSSFIKETAINSTADMLIGDIMTSFFEEEDLQLAEGAIPTNLKLVEGMIKASPKNEKLLLTACRLYTSYAFGFLEEVYFPYEEEEKVQINNKRAKAFYLRAKNYGMQVLTKNEEFKNALNGSFENFEKVVSKFNKDEIDSLFWTAYAWGNLINLSKDDTDEIVNLGRVEIMMKRVIELDEGYYNAGAHLFYMVYYGSRPEILGGNPEKAKEHYEKAVKLTNNKFLMADYLYAVYYSIQVQDKELFKSVLTKVIETDGAIFPQERLTNELAKKKASALIKLEDELF